MCLAEMAVGRQMRAMTNAATKIFMALVCFNGVLLFSLSKLANYWSTCVLEENSRQRCESGSVGAQGYIKRRAKG
jgi:hypothetical protein